MTNKKIILIFISISILTLGIIGIYTLTKKINPKEKFNQIDNETDILMEGPYFDNIYASISTNGENWQLGDLLAKHASVPDAIQLQKDIGNFKKGDLLVYFVDFAQFRGAGTETISLLVSHDNGLTWLPKQQVEIKNKLNKGAAVDPSVVQLSDGRLRLYFFGSEINKNYPGRNEGIRKIYSAISSDGINFNVEPNIRWSQIDLADPEVIFSQNKWLMYYSTDKQKTELAISDDGLNFKKEDISGVENGGMPGALITKNGIKLFLCGKDLNTVISIDGQHFQTDNTRVIPGFACDPSPVKLNNGKYLLIYKSSTPHE